MLGWIKLYRSILDKAIWLESTPEQKVILITLLMMANHEGKEWEWKGNRFSAAPGQFVTSLPSLVNKCGKNITTQIIRTALKRFVKFEFLTDESTKTGRLITIVNWGYYQSSEQQINKLSNSQVTVNQQTHNSQLTPNKNDKNDKNERNRNNNNSHSETPSDFKENNISEKIFQNAFNFYEQNFGMINSFIAQEIEHWATDLNEGVVIEAMKRALEQQKKWSYAKRILFNWVNKNVKTVNDVLALDEEFENRKKNRTPQNFNRHIRQEIVPDWLQEQKIKLPEDSKKVEIDRKRLEQELLMFQRKKEVNV